MKRFTRLMIELVVLLAIYLLGCQLAKWLAWPVPGGVVGLGLLLATFASGLVKPAALQLGAGVLMAEMLGSPPASTRRRWHAAVLMSDFRMEDSAVPAKRRFDGSVAKCSTSAPCWSRKRHIDGWLVAYW